MKKTRDYPAVTPALDWYAMYDDGVEFRFEPLACWATYRDNDDGSKGVVGLVVDEHYSDLIEADEMPYFEGYISRAEMVKTLADIDREQAKRAKQHAAPPQRAAVRSNVLPFRTTTSKPN
jgi:hypothetical protein